ncbi:hypothetical protein [Thalassolituus hydrocarboniclasticus]|uniref:Uncharacterized protein n=1 Tax=Thalassolituus hydrocarboniclasticus TaxID=2742796 RepID=A0ABY6A4J5_9GAMM|nr:hypothetical protein [Thalassolituus hydrocarboniclasticus]UXD86086.1 hypothetical protein HUF19_00865 [Thalassolituus hydrocarboniclasticus]
MRLIPAAGVCSGEGRDATHLFYLLHNPLVLALGVSLLLHLLLLAAPLQRAVQPTKLMPVLSLQLQPALPVQTVSDNQPPQRVPEQPATPAAENPTTETPAAPAVPDKARETSAKTEPQLTSPPLLRLPAGNMGEDWGVRWDAEWDAHSEPSGAQSLKAVPFDPRLRRQLDAVRSEQPEPQRDFIETGEAGSLAPQQRRVGDHCFLYSEKDALDEDSFDVWSPVTCAQ